jgi:hypothetical protein
MDIHRRRGMARFRFAKSDARRQAHGLAPAQVEPRHIAASANGVRAWALAAGAVILLVVSSIAYADPLAEAFVPDAGFNFGFILDDRFATVSTDTDFHGQKLARLSNGDVVVAGLVPAAYQVDQANGRFNVGLVRYGPGGERVAWPAPTPAYVSFFDRYLQFPNAYSNFTHIGGLVVAGGFIFVLADYTFSESQQQPDIVVFTEDGGFVGWFIAGLAGTMETGVGMVSFVVGGVRRIFTVNRVLNWIIDDSANYGFYERYLGLNRFTVGADGTLDADPAFGTGGRSSLRDYSCTYYTGDCDFDAEAISLVGSGNATLGVYEIYAIGSYINCHALCVGDVPLQMISLSPTSGSLIGRSILAVSDAQAGGRSLDVRARDIIARRDVLVGGGFADSVYLLASARQCGNLKGRGGALLHVDGNANPDPAFGADGVLLFGGEPAPSCPAADAAAADPQAMALGAYGRLAVVGSVTDTAVDPGHSDGFLAVLRTDLGGVADYAVHPALKYDSSPWGSQAGFNDVIAYDGGTFTAAGTMTTASAAAQFGTARFRSDRIFADDF